LSPHSANIDPLKIDRQCGGNLARLQRVYARGKEFCERTEEPRALIGPVATG